MNRRFTLAALFIALSTCTLWGQSGSTPQDTLSKFDRFNAKMEHFFKVFPVPIVTYSTEAGSTFGLAKFNLFHPSKKDTISKPSKISEVATFSTKGRVNVSISNDLILKENKFMILSFFNYRKQPEYVLGIGNDVSIDNVEQVTVDRIRFYTSPLVRVTKNYFLGPVFDLANYFSVKTDSNTVLTDYGAVGLNGGTDFGIGIVGALDSRPNRYNASSGALFMTTFMVYPDFLGSTYQFYRLDIDARKYFNPWLKHVIAIQAYTTYSSGDVPFYDLAMMGGEDRMRGYYKGALRDKVLIDAQVEYRMPVWNIFGITTWVATGRVADSYKNMSFNGLWLSYGGGIRIRVDSENNANLRFDMGFGPNGVSGFYFNFAEAF